MAFTENNVDGLIYMSSSVIRTKHAFTTRFGGVSTGDFASLNLGFGRGDSSIPHKTGWSFGVSARKNSLACPEDGGKKRKHQSNTKLAAHDPKILTRLKSFKTSRIGRRLVQRRLALLSNVRTHRKGSRALIRSSHPIIRSIVPRGLCCDSARRGGAARLVCNAQPVLRRKSEFSKAH